MSMSYNRDAADNFYIAHEKIYSFLASLFSFGDITMPCSAPEDHPKLPSNHCKYLPALIRDACAQCHGSCLRTPSSLSSEDGSPDDDLDDQNVIILEIRNRAMKAKSRPKDLLFSGSFSWSVSPTTGRVIVASKEKGDGEEKCEADDGEESEAFFSVKSCFSRCSSDGGSELKDFRRRSVFEEFKHCEGWPFGLSRRASMLPPLPSVPRDSWMWHKKKLVTKSCTLN
ncbi:uncharacterized protein LOC103712496 [Phoenix dactylifera]|uniref:Uncharacterized protein LOC103712496 n=1 Tax=Phoenix dactylifera TaxID=42345 RepID=A0A8B7CE68_PHODC|nr:uncharacterized protein LOC103712496 [Phoenix dactylifera]